MVFKFLFQFLSLMKVCLELRIDSCQHAMCIVFAKKMLTLGFESKYSQTDWDCRIRSVYGEENLFTFSVEIPPNSPSSFLSRMRANTSAMMFIFNDNIAFVACESPLWFSQPSPLLSCLPLRIASLFTCDESLLFQYQMMTCLRSWPLWNWAL